MSASAIIVAAGSSRRMGFDKLSAEIDGKTVLSRTLSAFESCEDLAEIVQRTCDQTKDYATSLDCKVVTHGLDHPTPIFGSAIELEQAFVNLIRNACEASKQSQVVTVSAVREAERAVIEVRDEGVGIPKEIVDEILDPFFTTRLKEGGTGLGLSVAHGVITDHGGSIDIESAIGEGTTIRVALPLAEDQQADPAR